MRNNQSIFLPVLQVIIYLEINEPFKIKISLQTCNTMASVAISVGKGVV